MRRPARPGAAGAAATAAAWLLALVGLPLMTVVMVPLRDRLELGAVLLLYVLMVVAVAAVGGPVPAVVAAVGGVPARQLVLHPAVAPLDDRRVENVLALVVFLVVAVVVSSLVDHRAGDARPRRRRATAEAETLASLAGQLVDSDPLPVLVIQMRHAFGLDGVALLRRAGDGWLVEASAATAPLRPEEADRPNASTTTLLALAVRGGVHRGDDRRVLNAFAAQLGRRPRAPPAARRGGDGGVAGRGQRAAHRVAAGRVTRPAHAARVDQGVGQRACAKHDVELDRRTDQAEFAGNHRRGDRPADDAGRQPARHAPDPGRRAAARAPRRGARRGRACRARQPGRPRQRRAGRRARGAHGHRRPGAARACRREPRRQRASCHTRPGTCPGRGGGGRRRDRPPRHRSRPRHRLDDSGSRCSSRSSASATRRTSGTGVGLGFAVARGFLARWRRADDRRHARRGHHDGGQLAARRRPARPGGRRDEPGAGRRRRAADPARPRGQPPARGYEVDLAATGEDALAARRPPPPRRGRARPRASRASVGST